MIRDTRNIYVDTEGKVPDYKHISISGDKPAILGTSWAGAFRSGLHRLLKQKYPDRTEAYLNEVFGYIPDDSEADESAAIVSKIIFGASFLEVSDNKTEGYRNVVRVKIDRFTGGAAGGALFTERPWYGGKTTLEISFPKGREDIKELLLLGLDGIDKGIMQVGGESAIGRGFFKVTTNVTVDGKEESIDKSKQNLVNAIERAGDTE
jgi:CRISPR/Cas system CMR subunit Cmr4 (Cas7 group RAMP superfamily)